MSTNVAGPEIERLVQLLARLPGLGPRSARRVALHLIRKRETLLAPLAEAMRIAQERIVTCSVCGNVDTRDPCTICADERRDLTALARVGFWALLALIVVGIVLIFVHIPGAELAYSVLGLVIFAGFTMFDFQRLRTNTDTATAPFLAASIFLDVLNVFLFFLEIFSGGER